MASIRVYQALTEAVAIFADHEKTFHRTAITAQGQTVP